MKVNKIKIIEHINVGKTSLSAWGWDGRGDPVCAPRLSHCHPQDQLPGLEERGGEVMTLLSSCRIWRGFLKQMVSR